MKSKAANGRPGTVVAIKRVLFLVLASLATGLAGQGQTPHPKPHPLASGTPQARLRFIPEVLTTVAGGGTSFYNGIAATSASLPSSINAIAFNSKGDLYLISRYPAALFKISASDGTISTVLGNYQAGGERVEARPAVITGVNAVPASQITLSNPHGIAIDSTDNVFVADTDDNVVYKLDAQNMVSVVAGVPGQSGYSGDGSGATGSLLNAPTGLALDTSGNLYISDSGNNALRKISAADGTITTIAGGTGAGYSGDGSQATQAKLKYPVAIAFDRIGNLLFSDANNYVIRKINLQSGDPQLGVITTIAGNHVGGYAGDGGPAMSASISNAYGLAVDAAGQTYIGDSSSDVVRRVALDGTISTIAGHNTFPSFQPPYVDGSPATQAYTDEVTGLAFDSKGTLYIAAIDIARVLRLGQGGALDFGQQAIATSATQTLTLVNEGNATATFGSQPFVLQGTGFTVVPAASQGCTQGLVLQPGASCKVSVTFAPAAAMSYHATITFTDDAADSPQVADLYGVGVLPATTTAITLSPQIATVGDVVTLTATVTRASGTGATPTGTVQFIDDNSGNVLAQGKLNSSGTVSVQTATLLAGDYYVEAQYGGDASYASSESDGMDLEIDAKTAIVALTSSSSTINSGSAVSLTAHVTSATTGTPTGNVLFQVDGLTAATVPLQNGAAIASVAIATPGRHTLQAVYAGDGIFAQAVSPGLPLVAHGALLQFAPGAATTVAGTPSDANHGGFSGDGGSAVSAYMHTPSGVISDGAGNLYIADQQNNVIRKVSVDGTISTFAGTPYAANVNVTRFGGDGGPAIYAYLTNPIAMAFDAANNFYIADYSNHAVRRVDAKTGVITTFAGVGGMPGHNQDSGAATSIYLNHPSALAFDGAGNLYIADAGNNLIRKVDAGGNLTTIAGRYGFSGNPVEGGQATQQVLHQPMGVAVDTAGFVYISDTSAGVVRRIDLSGNLYTFAGGASFATNQGDGGPVSASTLKNPQQMAFDLAGNLYIVDAGAGSVRKVDSSGIITTAAGSQTSQAQASHYDPAGSAATLVALLAPSGVGVTPDGSLLVTDDYNQTVWRVGPNGVVQFGPQTTGTTSDPQTVTLFNAGDRPLAFSANPYTVTGDYVVSSSGAMPCDFSAQLAIGASCNITVQYRPQTGALRGSIVFAGSGLGTPTVNLVTNSTVAATTTQLLLSGTTLNYGDNLLIYGAVAPVSNGPTPSGKISFYDATTLLGTASLSSGAGYIYDSTLTVGNHSLTAVYGGDGFYGTSTSDPTLVTVSGAVTQTTLSASSSTVSVGASVILTATVTSGSSALSSGSVTFFDGSTSIGTANVNTSGMATFATGGLSSGSHSFTAAFTAQGAYGGSTSAAVSVTVSGGGGGGGTPGLDYVLNLSSVPIVLHRGETKTIAVSAVQLGANYQGSVLLACGTLPSYVTCSFSPATLIIGGPVQNLTSFLTITSSAGYATNSRPVRIDPTNLVQAKP